jgi:hypothetical protein
MTSSEQEETALVLVKAVPHPSKRYGETVCCAGVTLDREWRRLYPVRFRHIRDKFTRWEWVKYRWRLPKSDNRRESRHVYEDTLVTESTMPESERSEFLEPLVHGSVRHAASLKASLALVRPHESRFRYKRKSENDIEEERRKFEQAAKQKSFFDKELAQIDPSPYEFRLRFRDESGWHDHRCEDWETTAAFWNLRRSHGEEIALKHLDEMYNEHYPGRGMALALGNVARRPQTWLLLGVIRLDVPVQSRLIP